MKAYQLSLFPSDEPVAINDKQTQQTSKRKFRPCIVEESCTTARAAQLLKISPTTLYRAKNQGRSYRRDRWTAICLAPNSWQVMHD